MGFVRDHYHLSCTLAMLTNIALFIFILTNITFLIIFGYRTLRFWRKEGFLPPSIRLQVGHRVSRKQIYIGAGAFILVLLGALFYLIYYYASR